MLKQLIFATVVGFAAACSHSGAALTSAELLEVLDIRAWHIPQPPSGKEWSINVVASAPPSRADGLTVGSALLSIRPVSDNNYEFVLKQRGARGAGPFSPCAEPDGAESLCDGYSLQFRETPVCASSDCSVAVIGEVTGMLDSSKKRWIVLSLEPTLTITPGVRTHVIPVRPAPN
jgi:hypothetical protein